MIDINNIDPSCIVDITDSDFVIRQDNDLYYIDLQGGNYTPDYVIALKLGLDPELFEKILIEQFNAFEIGFMIYFATYEQAEKALEHIDNVLMVAKELRNIEESNQCENWFSDWEYHLRKSVGEQFLKIKFD